jgi:hypothetical protein
MSAESSLIRELKGKFIREFTPSEKIFFLEKCREAVLGSRYPADEDLFYYCYFLTLRERIGGIGLRGGEGYLRLLLIEGTKDIEDAIKLYRQRLEEKKLSIPDPEGHRFIEYFSGN